MRTKKKERMKKKKKKRMSDEKKNRQIDRKRERGRNTAKPHAWRLSDIKSNAWSREGRSQPQKQNRPRLATQGVT